MPSQALTSLLAVRAAQERRAERVLESAVGERVRAEAEEARLVAAVEEARAELAARRRTEDLATERASEALARRQFWARLADGVAAREGALAAFRRDGLAGARQAERTARDDHARAHQRRAVVERVRERRAEINRRAQDLRAEAAADDRGHDRGPGGRRHGGATGNDDLG